MGRAREDVLNDWAVMSADGANVPQAAERMGMTWGALMKHLQRAKDQGDPRAVFTHAGVEAARNAPRRPSRDGKRRKRPTRRHTTTTTPAPPLGTPHPGIKQRPIVVETSTQAHPLSGLFTDPFFELLDRNPTECKGLWDLFESDGTVGGVTEMLRLEAAKAVCGRCPIQAECLDYSQRTAQVGFWAGFSDDERKTLRRSSNSIGASA